MNLSPWLLLTVGILSSIRVVDSFFVHPTNQITKTPKTNALSTYPSIFPSSREYPDKSSTSRNLISAVVADLAAKKAKDTIKKRLEERMRERAREQMKERIKEKVKDKLKESLKDKIIEDTKDKIEEKVKASIKDRITAWVKRRFRSRIDGYVLRKILKSMTLSKSSRNILMKVDDPYIATIVKLVPPRIIKSNDEGAKDNNDLDISDGKFSLGWIKTGKGFDEWEKGFIPAENSEISDDLMLRRIREDPFFQDPEGLQDRAADAAGDLLLDTLRSSTLYPIDDTLVYFNSTDECTKLLKDTKLNSIEEGGASPASYNTWPTNMSTDEVFERFFFNGLGATQLEQQFGPSSKPDLGPIEVDMEFMAGFEVRKGFRSYGCKIYFDTNQKVTGIYDTEKEQLVKPGEDEWEEAKVLAKASTFILATVNEHLIQSHLLLSSALSLANCKRLPPNHPLRRIINVFTFRTNKVNDGAFSSLVPVNSLLHRGSAFEYESLRKIFCHCIENSNAFQPFPKRNMRPELLEMSNEGKFPYHSEAVEYYEIMEKFVKAWLKEAGDAASDDYAKTFYDEMRNSTKDQKYTIPPYSPENMVDLLTQCFFQVTAYHEIVGTVIDYNNNPTFGGFRLSDGNNTKGADVQSFLIASIITATTGIKVPMLMKGYSNYFGR